jgi:hypothetical protein
MWNGFGGIGLRFWLAACGEHLLQVLLVEYVALLLY